MADVRITSLPRLSTGKILLVCDSISQSRFSPHVPLAVCLFDFFLHHVIAMIFTKAAPWTNNVLT